MLFKRRDKPGRGERMRAWFWPKRGWRRAWNYVWHRVTRLSGTPHAIALGFACGAFASFTPFMGFHFIIGFLCAYITRSSLLASALGTFVGNPLTFPLIWIMTYSLGSFLLGLEGTQPAAADMPTIDFMSLFTDWSRFWNDFWDRVWPVIMPMTLGGLPLGLFVGTVCYIPVRTAVKAYQAKRHQRFVDRAKTAEKKLERHGIET
jgi:uncharacterized protein (DUF2062 family)